MPASTQRGVWLALLAVFVAVCCMQVGAALGKLIFPVVGAAGASALRIFFASLILLAVFRPWRALPQGKAWRPLLLYGATLGFMNLFYYLSIARIPLGIAVALEFLGPLAVAVLNSRRPSDWLYVALAVIGVAILLPIHSGAGPLDGLGVVLAILAGACWGLYIIFGQRTSAVVPAGTATAIGMVVACCVVLPVGIAQSGAALLTPHILPIAVGIALLSSAIPYSLEMLAPEAIAGADLLHSHERGTRLRRLVGLPDPGRATQPEPVDRHRLRDGGLNRFQPFGPQADTSRRARMTGRRAVRPRP